MTRDQIRAFLAPVWGCLEEHGLHEEALQSIEKIILAVPIIIENESSAALCTMIGTRRDERGGINRLVTIWNSATDIGDERVWRRPSPLEVQNEMIKQA